MNSGRMFCCRTTRRKVLTIFSLRLARNAAGFSAAVESKKFSKKNGVGAYAKLSMFSEAEDLHRACLPARRRVYGDNDYQTLVGRTALAQVMGYQGRVAEAVTELRELEPLVRRVLGPAHQLSLQVREVLAYFAKPQ